MNYPRRSEAAFETVIESYLLSHGYMKVDRTGFEQSRAIFPELALGFIRETQPKEWAKLEALHGAKTGDQVLTDLCKWMDTYGSLATLRHGFKCYGRTLHVAFFKAAHGLNPELEARYAANRVGLTRQLHFSERNEKSLDVTLSLNGVPVATVELKNPLTGQRVDDARRQYCQDRDPREPIFEFKRRTLVHFAVDTEAVFMTTRLAGGATHFLPFNKGSAGGAGNPPDPQGHTYRTAYLWEEVLPRDSLLDLLARFLHLQTEEKRTEDGRKVKTEAMIFPRYHQLQAVRQLEVSASKEGPGHNYLVEHSAGSGKSNTIGWLAHRLASLHNEQDQRVFDSVIVVTDRLVLDQQLQDTIYQFEHRQGVVRKIDESSKQLAEALESSVPIIVTTLQKFPFVSRQLLKLAEERGGEGNGGLPTRRCAVIIDEAHSSQSGEASTELKGVLGGEELRKEAQRRAAEEGLEDIEPLFRSLAKRGRQANLSFFAFTATPKHKTLAVFGRNGAPFHRYTMRQAIEEGFIDGSGIYFAEEVQRFCAVFFKPRERQSAADHQVMNATLDPAVDRFRALQETNEDEAELWRGKLQAFRNLYSFLSQVIPYQDSDLERLYTFLRHLSAKLPKRNSGPRYNFDDEVRLEYYRLQKISEGSISLKEGYARPLDGPSEVGSGMVREAMVALSRLIDVVNERFGTDFTEADQLFFDQIIEAALADEGLRQAAKVNPADKFSLVFNHLLETLFVERMDQNEEIFARFMNEESFRKVIGAWMASEVYRKLRYKKDASYGGTPRTLEGKE